MKILYLLVNFFTIIIPFLFSFHPKIKFYRTWKAFFPAALLAGFGFIIWDAFFTLWGVWGFNPRYITGFLVLNLPIEEILFFICIPYSCVFTYFCLSRFFDLSWHPKLETTFLYLFSFSLLVTGVIFWELLYTSITLISTGLLCLYLKLVAKIDWFGEAVTVYAILLVPFIMVNGVLTGTGLEEPVVWYNPDENLGIRLFTIPVEDAFYGLELILLNIFFYKILMNRSKIQVGVKA